MQGILHLPWRGKDQVSVVLETVADRPPFEVKVSVLPITGRTSIRIPYVILTC